MAIYLFGMLSSQNAWSAFTLHFCNLHHFRRPHVCMTASCYSICEFHCTKPDALSFKSTTCDFPRLLSNYNSGIHSCVV